MKGPKPRAPEVRFWPKVNKNGPIHRANAIALGEPR
jgi:hypothetical protein